MSKRRLILAGGWVAAIVTLACSGSERVTRAADGPGADVRGRPVLAEAAAEPLGARQRRSASASTRATTCSSSIGSDTLERAHRDRRRHATPPTSECCIAAPPVLEFDPAGQPGRTRGAARARATTGPASNHGITIDNKDNVWIGGNGTERLAHPQVHARRQVPACRSAQCPVSRAAHATASDDTSGASPRSRSIARRTRRTSPTATATSASPCIDMDTGKIKRFWGAYGNMPSDTNFGPYNPDAPLVPAVPQPGALRRADATTAWCTSATGRTTASRSSRRTASS